MRKKGERAAKEKAAAGALEEEAKSAARKAEQGGGDAPSALAGGGGAAGGRAGEGEAAGEGVPGRTPPLASRRPGCGGGRSPGLAAGAALPRAALPRAALPAEEHQCSGLLEQDFHELCARAGLSRIPKVTLRPAPAAPGAEESEAPAEKDIHARLARIQNKYSYFQPCIQVETEHDDPKNVRAIFLRGWKIEEKMLGILSKCLPPLANLQAVHLWKVGLTDLLLPPLIALLTSCTSLRTLSLEGNPLPEHSFYKLMGSESTLAHLSLRNNDIGDAAAKLIGQSLSTLGSSNRSLVSLVLSFNRISDVGAGYIAEGLRLNRSLLSLSLAHNDIGDTGAFRLAEVLAPFALTHAEVVERRRLLLKEPLGQSCTKHSEIKSDHPLSLSSNMALDKLLSAKQNKTAAKKKELLRKEEKGQLGPSSISGTSNLAALPGRKEDVKQTKKPPAPPDPKAARAKGVKPSSKEKRSPTMETEALAPAGTVNPLLEQAEHRDGKVFLPGNRELINLNLACERGVGGACGAGGAALGSAPRVWGSAWPPPSPAVGTWAVMPSTNRGRAKIARTSPVPNRCAPCPDNHITERGLRAFLAVVEGQQQQRKVPAGAKGKLGLLRLSLQKNCFPPACAAFVQLQELLRLRDPVPKRRGKEEEQGGGA
ncbi:leucine-rich repeat-containing protein 71 [Dromaius novaehollandiae]|uniref:leucine-rich repeat-containing protein 71 n=1 Tax=Dromaius novaehollandiae TaxID=8790 RepID=UPI003120179C